jgi:SH3-like domain-containing protein
MMSFLMRMNRSAVAIMVAIAVLADVAWANEPSRLPPYASLKVDRVELYGTPARDGAPLWVLLRAGLPVQVLRREGGWTEVRASDATQGWVATHHLSNRRTAMIAGAATMASRMILLSEPREAATPVAYLEAGVVAGIETCDDRWCQLAIGRVKGWYPRTDLWGVDPTERFN